MFREAHATWKGGPYAGEGAVSTPSGVLNNDTYAFGSLAGTGPFTTPCELLAAAIASCMSIVVAQEMAKSGITPIVVDTSAVLTLNDVDNKWRITHTHLTITARTTDPESSRFQQVVESARRACPILSTLNLDVTWKGSLISLTAPALI